MSQLNFEGQTREQVAIDRIRNFEPPEGYYLAFSGGKDSIVLYDLAVKAGVKFDAHYNITGIDPPELVQFIRANYLAVNRDMPKESMWKLIYKNGLPNRHARWCCKELKEVGGSGRIVLTGIRWEESSRRRSRQMVEVCYMDTSKRYVHPIIDWSARDIWDYIQINNIKYCSLYDEQFKRLGCILCPMNRNRTYEMYRWPKIVDAWKRAADKYWTKQTPGLQKFSSGADYFNWWLSDNSHKKDEAQAVMFE